MNFFLVSQSSLRKTALSGADSSLMRTSRQSFPPPTIASFANHMVGALCTSEAPWGRCHLYFPSAVAFRPAVQYFPAPSFQYFPRSPATNSRTHSQEFDSKMFYLWHESCLNQNSWDLCNLRFADEWWNSLDASQISHFSLSPIPHIPKESATSSKKTVCLLWFSYDIVSFLRGG